MNVPIIGIVGIAYTSYRPCYYYVVLSPFGRDDRGWSPGLSSYAQPAVVVVGIGYYHSSSNSSSRSSSYCVIVVVVVSSSSSSRRRRLNIV